jgi:hypothetical protein
LWTPLERGLSGPRSSPRSSPMIGLIFHGVDRGKGGGHSRRASRSRRRCQRIHEAPHRSVRTPASAQTARVTHTVGRDPDVASPPPCKRRWIERAIGSCLARCHFATLKPCAQFRPQRDCGKWLPVPGPQAGSSKPRSRAACHQSDPTVPVFFASFDDAFMWPVHHAPLRWPVTGGVRAGGD